MPQRVCFHHFFFSSLFFSFFSFQRSRSIHSTPPTLQPGSGCPLFSSLRRSGQAGGRGGGRLDDADAIIPTLEPRRPAAAVETQRRQKPQPRLEDGVESARYRSRRLRRRALEPIAFRRGRSSAPRDLGVLTTGNSSPMDVPVDLAVSSLGPTRRRAAYALLASLVNAVGRSCV